MGPVQMDYMMTPKGTPKLASLTSSNIGKSMAFVVNDVVQQTTNMVAPVTEGQAEITLGGRIRTKPRRSPPC